MLWHVKRRGLYWILRVEKKKLQKEILKILNLIYWNNFLPIFQSTQFLLQPYRFAFIRTGSSHTLYNRPGTKVAHFNGLVVIYSWYREGSLKTLRLLTFDIGHIFTFYNINFKSIKRFLLVDVNSNWASYINRFFL